MPVVKVRTVFEVARNIKTFLNLDVGMTRGTVPDFEQKFREAQARIRDQDQQLKKVRKRLSDKNEDLVKARKTLAERGVRSDAPAPARAQPNDEQQLRRLRARYGPLVPAKLALIDFVVERFKVRSFADLGGVWNVNGGYTFYALDRHRIEKAMLVDHALGKKVPERAKTQPNLRLLQGSFGEESVAEQVGHPDAVFFFDVLLHQVAPDWDEVLKTYADRVKVFVVYNQQWVGPGPSFRLMDLGEEGYFRNVPVDSQEKVYREVWDNIDKMDPISGRPYRDVHRVFQWGITDEDLIAKMRELGFRLHYFQNHGSFQRMENFENHSFVFFR